MGNLTMVPVPKPEGHPTHDALDLHQLGQDLRFALLTGGDKPETWDKIARLATVFAARVKPTASEARIIFPGRTFASADKARETWAVLRKGDNDLPLRVLPDERVQVQIVDTAEPRRLAVLIIEPGVEFSVEGGK